MSQSEARRWPDLFALVEAKVKPERLKKKDGGAKEKWWQFIRPRPELTSAIRGLDRVLVISRVTENLGFSFLPSGMVYSERLAVFAFTKNAAFALLQSRNHEFWARFFGSTLEDRLIYNATVCFEAFPFPRNWRTNAELERVGKTYYEFRANLMVRNNEGLTTTYNRFHNRDERDPEILKLRELHDAMDRAVIDAYEWTDIKPTCEFILDYEEEENDDGKPRRKKKPWRYRWPDEFRDEVLARLLALNQQRAAEEKAMGTATSTSGKRTGKGGKKGSDPRNTLLFD
jgi:hypothetical protein